MPRYEVIKTTESLSSLRVNGRDYDLQLEPDRKDPLVLEQQNELLRELSLDELNDNLYLSVELLFVAYNGVAGAQDGNLQKEVNDIMGDLALLCNKCSATMGAFKDETANIVRELGQAYRWLVQGNEKLAVKKLAHCGDSSLLMSKAAEELSVEFKELQQKSVRVRSNTILQEAAEFKRGEEADKAIREMTAKHQTERVNQEELVQQVAQMQLLYDDAKKREEEESKKSLALGIVSAIFGAVGAGLGAFAAAKNPAGSVSAPKPDPKVAEQLEQAQKDSDGKKARSKEANDQLLDAKDKLQAGEKQRAALKKEAEDLKLQAGIIEGVAEKERTDAQKAELESLQKQLDSKTKEITTKDTAVKELEKAASAAEQTAKDRSAEYGAAATALQRMTDSTDKMAAAAASAEESVRAEKMKFLDQKFKLEAEKRKSLVAMVAFAEEIKNAKVEKGNADVSVQSLHAAVEALGKVIGTLTTASLFWKQMSVFCLRMVEKGFQSDLKDLLDPGVGLSTEERREIYQGPDFMMSFLVYMCQWVALNGVSGDYLVSAEKAREKCLENIAQSPTIEAARRNAPELARKMGMMLSSKISASASKSSELLQQQARLQASAN
jgi:hypothetical protein